ncbi:hypothetical protein [Streptomyces sp. NBC_01304]|uniref:hypothetical protein n=1 Tax=Streptomyces sp. NBC_01304 TaxID=2903818 RepID=UPI002E1284FE|nr:hypothetical protein OG430_05290 [Streptomyces sp. NBC_01304]
MSRTEPGRRVRVPRLRLAAVAAAALLVLPAGQGVAYAVEPEELAGTWVSPASGDRGYPREVDFDASGTFRVRDLVSPCPPKVQCVWSGINSAQGTYAVEGDDVRLTYDNGRTDAMPDQLRYEEPQLIEELPDGGRAEYTRRAGCGGHGAVEES